jgi:anti-anti-sigma factor
MGVIPDLRTVCSADLQIVVGDQGTTRTIRLDGALDATADEGVRRAVARAVSDRPECVLVDLGRLNVIDADGVAVVVDLVRRCRSQHIRLVIVPGPAAVQRAFASARLDLALPFVAERVA